MPMDLIPKVLVIGAFTPPMNQNLPGVPKIGTRQLTDLYGSVADDYGYRSLTIAPGGEGCQMVGRTPDDVLSITPPQVHLVQDLAQTLSVDSASDRAAGIFREVLSQLKLPMFGLGIRIVYRLPIGSGGDSRQYMLRQFFAGGSGDLSQLGQSEGVPVWAGAKFVINPVAAPGATYTVTVEPSNADHTMLYLDVDAQLQTALDPATLKSQIQAVEHYTSTTVSPLLEG